MTIPVSTSRTGTTVPGRSGSRAPAGRDVEEREPAGVRDQHALLVPALDDAVERQSFGSAEGRVA